ncbi:DUF4163 domain-containing protein [Lutispora sp.]|uniref:DUF4163 domain-containing protein n=1 Tax=Lutispora sp. TaxID=2828727 RepID=UPI003561828A
MLKNGIIVTLLILLTLSLVACNKSENRSLSTKNEAETLMVDPIVEKHENENNPNNQQKLGNNDNNYIINELNYSKNDDKFKCNIKYPQISGLSDNEKQKKINRTLKNEAIKVINYYENPYGSVELSIDYKVTLKNPNILSVQYSGVGSVSNAAHPNNLFFTTNINIMTGERLRLKDIVEIDKNFAQKFLNEEFKSMWPEQSEALEYFTSEEVQEYFKEADSLDNIGTEKQSDVFSYLTTNSLGISISVGHAIGDHAEFEIKYQNIRENIKTENEIWQGLLHYQNE